MKLTTRHLFRGKGEHRPSAQPVPLLRPDDVVANDAAYCPAEQRTTFHGMHRDGSRHCWTCRTETPAGEQ
ncbi:hypothetical protein ACWERY_16005 [Streptomyces sp. NPDC004082]